MQNTTTVDQVRKFYSRKSKRAKKKTKADYLKRFASTPTAPVLSKAEQAKQRGLFERHDEVVYQFRVPLPPTSNNTKSIFDPPRGHARLITTAEARAYYEAVKKLWGQRKESWKLPLTGRIRLLLTFWFRDRRRNDISNRIKVLEDALTQAGVWGDDCQIDDGRQLRGGIDPNKVGFVDVIIESIGE